ncbi:hypothetical protein Dimus_014080 [Dionaea muscipula]
METPSSTRRVTRSQMMSTLSNSIPHSRMGEDEFEKGLSKSRKKSVVVKDRSAMIDITNDSPIIGLATGSAETPLSSLAKQRGNKCKKTPGSGEALLRGTVKTLLQKVEEEKAELSKLSLQGHGPFLNLRRCLDSPSALLAPTPANTPEILYPDPGNETTTVKDDLMGSTNGSPIEDQLILPQAVKEIEGGDYESEKSMITRSLLFDFSEKSESSDSSDCSSVVTNHEGRSVTEDDDASVWSIQVNASARDEDEDEDDEDEVRDEDEYDEEEEEEEEDDDDDDGLLLDDLCEGMRKMNVKMMGKHTRFMYNSDDEIVEESSVLHLRGLPSPKGKHLRFPVGEEGDD